MTATSTWRCRWTGRVVLAFAIAVATMMEGATGQSAGAEVVTDTAGNSCGGSEAELTEAVTVTVRGYTKAVSYRANLHVATRIVEIWTFKTWDNRTETLFGNGVAAMLVGGQIGDLRLKPRTKILYTRASGSSNLLVAFCVALYPSADLIDGFQLTMDLSEESTLGYFSGASGGMTFSDVTNAVTAECTVVGDIGDVLKEIDWMVVGSIFAVTGLVLLGGAIVCLVSGCGEKQAPPQIIISGGGPLDVSTARTRYVREVMQPGADYKGQVQVDLGMGLKADTTLHTHL